MKRSLYSWTFRKLRSMIEYKAEEEGIPTEDVEPSLTSQTCNECGSHDTRRDGIHFACHDCGYSVNADVNGAFNIALRKS
ncbi:zinc ribbon domain-containing protein [Halorutilales archaeon Cl-col2-1]